MSKPKTITADLFVSLVEQIAAERPAYKHGHDGSDGYCDCIGLIRGALERAGISTSNMRGTNNAARKRILNLHKIQNAAGLQLGQVVLKVRDPDDKDMPLPKRYRKGGSAYNGDDTNYTHIGAVTQTAPLQITHMTSPTAQHDSKLGRWCYAGDLPWIIPVDTGGTKMTATITADSGSWVRVRTSPGGDTIAKLTIGTQVEVVTSGPEWCIIKWSGGTGYIMAKYLAIDGQNKEDDSAAESITVELTIAQAEALVQLADAIVGAIGRR